MSVLYGIRSAIENYDLETGNNPVKLIISKDNFISLMTELFRNNENLSDVKITLFIKGVEISYEQ